MNDQQKWKDISLDELLPQVESYKTNGFRLAQICALVLPDNQLELNYSFDKDLDFHNLKVRFPQNTEIPSVSRIFLSAFLYENEIHDQFGIQISNIAIDYKGKFFKIAKAAPFNPGAVQKA